MTIDSSAPLFLPVYRRHPVVFERGEGVWLYDDEGRRYLDLLAGIATNVLGHAHPALVAAVSRQVSRLVHTTNLFHHTPGMAAARAVVERLGGGRVFFCNSGTEANEAAIKLARKWAWRGQERGRREIVAVEGSFHGRTLGSLSITVQPAKWEGFDPLPGGVVTVAPDDVDGLDRAVGERTAAVFIETIQGEGGVRPLAMEFVRAARQLTAERGALLVIDEVQTGMGRTGQWWDHLHYGVRPDVVTLAKGLAGGVPMGAMWVAEEYAGALQPSDHGTTQGGNPLACAACAAVFEAIEAEGLLERARRSADVLARELAPLGGVRGRGLLLAVELGRPVAGAVVRAGLERGVVVNDVTPTAIRLAPPLVLSEEEAREGAARLRAAVEAVG